MPMFDVVAGFRITDEKSPWVQNYLKEYPQAPPQKKFSKVSGIFAWNIFRRVQFLTYVDIPAHSLWFSDFSTLVLSFSCKSYLKE